MVMKYKASSEVSLQALVQAGLTQHQAAVYEVLIQHGSQKATKIAFLAGVPRTLSYKVLDELKADGLVVKKDEPGKVSVFTPAHPLKLKELADKRLVEAKDAKVALESTLSSLISDFNTVSGQPGVRILEGISGIEEMLEDQLNEGQPVYLLRSPMDIGTLELQTLMYRHLKELSKQQIPFRSTDALPSTTMVAIYANKVAITAYEDGIITTIIENKAINQTFKLIFEYMWKLAESHR